VLKRRTPGGRGGDEVAGREQLPDLLLEGGVTGLGTRFRDADVGCGVEDPGARIVPSTTAGRSDENQDREP
jgi:hypothetical protein